MLYQQSNIKNKIFKGEKENGRANYKHNLKVGQSKEIIENEESQQYLNKTFHELYKEYINSEDFEIREINHFRDKQMTEEYIGKYKNLSKNLIEFFNK